MYDSEMLKQKVQHLDALMFVATASKLNMSHDDDNDDEDTLAIQVL